MKKLLTIILAIALIFVFAACNDNSTNDDELTDEQMSQIENIIDQYLADKGMLTPEQKEELEESLKDEQEDDKAENKDNEKNDEESGSDINIERTRYQKDDSSMDEVTKSVMLALADQDIYDEVMLYTCYGNVSDYIDTEYEQEYANYKVINRPADGAYNDQYRFQNDIGDKDGVVYYAAGNMHGVTITFQPENNKMQLKNAIINKFVSDVQQGSNLNTRLITKDRVADIVRYPYGEPDYVEHGTLSTSISKNKYLFNRLRATLGDTIELKSNKYKNSEYTVFIKMSMMSPTGTILNDSIMVYGEWNGTNLK